MILLFTGCEIQSAPKSQIQDNSIQREDIQKTPEPQVNDDLIKEDEFQSLSETQVKDDLIKREEIQNCFSSDYTYESSYTLSSFAIEKAQLNSEKKQDIIYCNISVVNDYFNVDLYAQCTYNYYDIGGWILDDLSVLEKNVNPIRAAEGQELVNKVINESPDDHYPDRIAVDTMDGRSCISLRHGELSLVDCVLYEDSMLTGINVCYKSDVLDVKGRYFLRFDSINGWRIDSDSLYEEKLVMMIDDYTADYSSALGKFTSVQVGGRNILKYDLDVVDISDDLISYKIFTEGYETYEYVDDPILMDEFDPLTGSVQLRTGTYEMFGYTLDSPLSRYYYNPIDDCWDEYGGPNYPDSYSSNQFYVPRQLGR